MKTLYDFILERQYVNFDIDFELFSNFMNDSVIDGNYDDSPYYNLMREQFINKFDEKLWKIFYSWCESYLFLKNSNLKDFYKSISNIPLDRLPKLLGAGSNGVVMSIQDKVIKYFYGESINKYDEDFLKYCKTHPEVKVFPTVYKIGKNWCIMEKLNTNTPDIRRLFELIEKEKINGKNIYNWVKEKNVDTSIFNDKQLAAYKWCIDCKKAMEDIGSSRIEWPGDLFSKNVGQRDNKEFVYFDI